MKIREETLCPAHSWTQANNEEVREILAIAGLSGAKAAAFLGLGQGGDRTARRWTRGEFNISYASWALLVVKATGKKIWEE